MPRCSPIALLALFAPLASGGCGQASRPLEEGENGNPSGAGAADALREERVTWDQDGIIDSRWGITGGWYAYNDCGSGGPAVGLPCTLPDPDILGPDGAQGWTASARQVCMKGTVPRVELGPDGMLAFDLQWGAGTSFNLGGADVYDATAHGITGFMFDITQGAPGPPAPPTIRISLQMPGNVAVSHAINVVLPSIGQRVMFDEIEQGSWVMEPTAFRPQEIQSIKFEVNPNVQAPKDYDLCVSNFRVLCPGECIP